MAWIPGWDSVAGAHWWENFYFWASIVALILLGVSEIVSHRYTERKDELAAIEQTDTQRRHDEEMSRLHADTEASKAETAKALAQAAETAERAAALEKEAAETRLQYEKLKAAVAWRIIEPNNMKRLVKRLSERPSVVQLEYVQGDPEAQGLAAQLLAAFREAKWDSHIMAHVYIGAASGIWVLPNATPSDSTRLSVSTVRDAFASIGLSFESQGGPARVPLPGETWGPSSPPVKVIVGAKPEPTFP